MATAFRHVNECPVCMVKSEDPKVLPCDHSLCANCVQRITRGSRIKCPVCNTQHAVSKVRSDFRLTQFRDAWEEKQQRQKAATKTDDGLKCELCYKQPVLFYCDDCEQWICKDCKTVHLRTKATKHHIATPLTVKCQEVKDKFNVQSENIQRKLKLQSETIDAIDGALRGLPIEQATACEALDKLRQISHRDVDEVYDSIDAKITEFIYTNTETLQGQKAKFVKQAGDFRSKWERLEQMVKDSAAQLAMKGNSILEEATKLSEMNQTEDVHITEVEIKVLRGMAWDASTAAVLELNGRDIEVRVTGAQDGSEQDGSVQDGGYHDSCLKDGGQQDGDLSSFRNKQFVQQKQVRLKTLPYALCLCNHELWICQSAGTIQICNHEFRTQRNFSNMKWGNVWGVTETHTGDMLLAGSKGLFHIKPSGEQISKIDSGMHTSVAFSSNKAYAYTPYRARICIYEYSHNTWTKMDTVNLPFRYHLNVTLSVTNKTINACSHYDNKVIAMSLTGNVLKTLGEGDFRSPDRLRGPWLCQEYLDGSLLIADERNNRLQTVSQSGQWNIVNMEPKVNKPRDAVFTDNKLFVVSRDTDTLSVYKCE